MEKINTELVENLLHKTELVIITKQIQSYIGKCTVKLLYNVNVGYIVRFTCLEQDNDFTTTNLEVAVNKFNSYLD